ncbi:MAG: ABC transporter permease, partial [Gammaproteobacteria bacterium]|nr:ABC transporter permease [Gammaproteobacteria bacterium]
FLIGYGIEPGFAWFGIVPVLLAQFVLILACSLFAASLTPFFPELKLIIDNVILALMFLSGVFFNLDSMEPGVREVLMLNPVAILIRDARGVLLGSELPVDHGLLYVLVVSAVLASLATFLLVRYDRLYPKVLTS